MLCSGCTALQSKHSWLLLLMTAQLVTSCWCHHLVGNYKPEAALGTGRKGPEAG